MEDYSGRLGGIWLHSPGVYWAIEFTPEGNEKLRRNIPAADLPTWLGRLGVPESDSARDYYRLNFPTTVKQIQKRFTSSKNPPNTENRHE